MRLAIIIEGGNVTDIISDDIPEDLLKVVVIDYDDPNPDSKYIKEIYQDNQGYMVNAIVTKRDVEFPSINLDKIF